MTHPCPECTETPCLCGAQGYLVLTHEDIEHQVASIPRLLSSQEGELEEWCRMLGEWVMEQLFLQEGIPL
jgi:hypothetical protein